MPGLSVHVVDVARGIVASGLRVRVERLDAGQRVLIAQGAIAPTGLLPSPEIAERLVAGVYEVTFEIGAYLRAEGVLNGATAFLDVTPFRFVISDPDAHYHLPFKFTPWGFSCFRGSS